MSTDDPLDIPDFLRREGNSETAGTRGHASEHDWIMPPVALGAVARAVRGGCDTTQKIRKRTRGRYSDAEIRKALRALIRSGDVARDGRRYHWRPGRATP